MHRREFLVTAAIGGHASLTGCSSGDDGTADGTEPVGGGSGTDYTDDGRSLEEENGDCGGKSVDADTGGASDEPEPSELASIRTIPDRYDPNVRREPGARNHRSGAFRLEDGLTVVTYDHGAGLEFVVELLDEDGDRAALVVDHDGSIEGAAAIPTTAGDYRIEVTSLHGYWTYEVAQPEAPEEAIHRPPVEARGTGPDVVGPVELRGEVSVHAEHDGESDFTLACYDENATGPDDVAVVFDESGVFDGEETIEFDGTTWIGVDAGGAWEFGIE